jgi:hypothetical protein
VEDKFVFSRNFSPKISSANLNFPEKNVFPVHVPLSENPMQTPDTAPISNGHAHESVSDNHYAVIELDADEKIQVWAYSSCYWKMVSFLQISLYKHIFSVPDVDTHYFDDRPFPLGSLLVSEVVCEVHVGEVRYSFLYARSCSVSG